MKLLEKTRLIRHRKGRNPMPGFVAYVHNTRPALMHCFGWEDYSDGYDDYALQRSPDNGVTWSRPRVKFRGETTERGRVRYGEPSAFWDADREKLVVLVDKTLYEGDALHHQTRFQVVEHLYDGRTGRWSQERDPELSPGRSLAVSFAFALKTRRGNLLFPACRALQDAAGKIEVDPRSRTPIYESLTLLGRWNERGTLDWTLGNPVPVDRRVTTRGFDEHTYAELPDGKIAAVIRGSNAGAPELPGYKWLALSADEGRSWSTPTPVPVVGGDPIPSGANGSALLRSPRNGKLYWLGNLCRDGETAQGNAPRHTLMLLECQEEPFAWKRESLFVLDRDGPGDSPDLQLSNFRYYLDRQTGDLVVYLTRLAERGMARWQEADYYRYRVRMD